MCCIALYKAAHSIMKNLYSCKANGTLHYGLMHGWKFHWSLVGSSLILAPKIMLKWMHVNNKIKQSNGTVLFQNFIKFCFSGHEIYLRSKNKVFGLGL